MWSLREARVWAVRSTVATRRGALFPPNPGDESPGYGRKPLTRQRELPPSAQAEQGRTAGSGEYSGRRDFQSFADAFGEKVADLGVPRDGLDEAIGRVDPDGMPPAFPFQPTAVFLQMTDKVAAFHECVPFRVRRVFQQKK